MQEQHEQRGTGKLFSSDLLSGLQLVSHKHTLTKAGNKHVCWAITAVTAANAPLFSLRTKSDRDLYFLDIPKWVKGLKK